jgi:hypothetical protein
VQATRPTRGATGHVWLFDLLFAGTPAVTWCPAGSLPPGFKRADQFAVLKAGKGRSFMVSVDTRRGSASALTAYNALRPGRTRLARRALGLGLRTGVAQHLVRDKIDIGVAFGVTPDQLAEELLSQHVRGLVGSDSVVLAFGGGSGPYRKPVLQVFSAAGTPLAYIKVGWNDWARAAVAREAAALQACSLRKLELGVPEYLGQSTWRGLDLLVTGPLPAGIRRLDSGTAVPDADVLREISSLTPGFTGELAASPWWLGMRERIDAGRSNPAAGSALERAAADIERGYGRVPLTFGACHGDLVPWNLARAGSRLYAWDWESSTALAPLGFDAVHGHFQIAFIARQLPLAESSALAADQAAATLDALGVPRQAHRLVGILHLLELAVRHEEARRSTGDVDVRLYPAVTGLLERACLQRGMTGKRSAGRPA